MRRKAFAPINGLPLSYLSGVRQTLTAGLHVRLGTSSPLLAAIRDVVRSRRGRAKAKRVAASAMHCHNRRARAVSPRVACPPVVDPDCSELRHRGLARPHTLEESTRDTQSALGAPARDDVSASACTLLEPCGDSGGGGGSSVPGYVTRKP
ncbi:hypothetical protein MRX96_030287 [Rhipicephalus microplus]